MSDGVDSLGVFDKLSRMSGMEFAVYLAVVFITVYTVFMAYLETRGSIL